MKKQFTIQAISSLIVLLTLLPSGTYAQPTVNKDTVLVAAREIIKETGYCGLITIDSAGLPQVRTMNPFPLVDNELVIWFATSRSSQKVKEIKANPNVCVYFADHVKPKGYVNITGTAQILDDKELLLKMKRDYWQGIPNWQDIFVLIKIVPKTISVINYKHGLNNNPNTFKAPTIEF